MIYKENYSVMQKSNPNVHFKFAKKIKGVSCKNQIHTYILNLQRGANKGTLEEGLEPSTLWLTATRSNQLSYSSCLVASECLYRHILLVV